jgi:hypothetical protein
MSATDTIADLDKEQHDVLADTFFRQHKGAIGVRAL